MRRFVSEQLSWNADFAQIMIRLGKHRDTRALVHGNQSRAHCSSRGHWATQVWDRSPQWFLFKISRWRDGSRQRLQSPMRQRSPCVHDEPNNCINPSILHPQAWHSFNLYPNAPVGFAKTLFRSPFGHAFTQVDWSCPLTTVESIFKGVLYWDGRWNWVGTVTLHVHIYI